MPGRDVTAGPDRHDDGKRVLLFNRRIGPSTSDVNGMARAPAAYSSASIHIGTVVRTNPLALPLPRRCHDPQRSAVTRLRRLSRLSTRRRWINEIGGGEGRLPRWFLLVGRGR